MTASGMFTITPHFLCLISAGSDELTANSSAQQREETCDISLHIAITGESGSGKSTFVNAVRGLRNGDEGAAPTGAVERSKEPIPYFHPDYPNYPAHKYLELVKFDRFDFFIIVSDTGCRENDCYFVRSKIDNFMRDERRNEDFSAERSLREMRENCVQGEFLFCIVSPQVFLVSSFEPNLYDFSLLQQTLDRDLPKNKRDTLLFIMPNINPEIIIKKKKAFQSRIKYWAGLSGTVAAVPVPGLSVAVDIGLMVRVVKGYVTDFSIDKSSLEKLAERTNVVLTQLACVAAFMTAEESFRWIPVVGLVASAGLSFVVIYKALNSFLNTLADDAQRMNSICFLPIAKH
uniref:Interferon-inducible GTPase 5-like n=1 Tax=Maylandia zebra TaxID=106582 RepID=A0A3P9B4P5_9CICH